MKKIITVVILMFAVSSTLFAQKNKKEELSVEQKTDLKLKKLALKLDLTQAQQRQIKPLLAEQISQHMAMKERRKAMKESDKKPSTDERYQMKNKMLDKQIVFKAEMKKILDEKQYEKFNRSYGKRAYPNKLKEKKHREHKEH